MPDGRYVSSFDDSTIGIEVIPTWTTYTQAIYRGRVGKQLTLIGVTDALSLEREPYLPIDYCQYVLVGFDVNWPRVFTDALWAYVASTECNQ